MGLRSAATLKRLWVGLILAALAPAAPPMSAQGGALVPGHARGLAVEEAGPAASSPAGPAAAHLAVTTPSFPDGAEIPQANTQYGGNIFPGLAWTAGPPATRSYAVVVQGRRAGDAQATTSIHLVVFNIPAGTTHLDRGLSAPPAGAAFGPNVHGPHQGYVGPHAHPDTENGYHFQVLALDTTLPPDPDATYDALLAAMQGHVLATGQVVGLASHDPDAPPAVTSLPGPVKLQTGLLQGLPGRNVAVTVFKGVPYAAPPVGDLRFRAPQPPLPWTGVHTAGRFGPLCPQLGDQQRMSEDCLFANVWTGARSGAERRPVYVWIYGGGFSEGTGSDPEFDGEALAAQGVVVVTFNYRIGPLGFLATPELSRESGHNSSGNFGLLDDIQMLRWVHENIAAFGGDPARVTIGGQSAGAGSVGFLAMSPLARGLFGGGILESHARYSHDTELRYLSVSYRTLASAEAAGTAFAESRGAPTAAELRALPWQKLIAPRNANDEAVETGSDAKPPLFRPVVDGWVIPKDYSETYAAGTENCVAILAGNNRDETGAVPEFTFARRRAADYHPAPGSPPVNVTLAQFHAAARRKFGPLAEQFLALYPATTDEEAARQSSDAARDNSRISTWLWGQDWRRHCERPLFTYFWTHRPTGDPNGAHHGSEILFAFNNLDMSKQPWTAEDRRIADTVSAYWVDFISHTDPNGPGLPPWPGYKPDAPTVMEIGDEFRPIPVASPEKIAFWRRFFATQPAW